MSKLLLVLMLIVLSGLFLTWLCSTSFDHRAPTITIVTPNANKTVVSTARTRITFNAIDARGIQSVWLVYRIQSGVLGAGRLESFEISNHQNTTRLDATFDWNMAPLTLNAGDQITFWLEAGGEANSVTASAPVRLTVVPRSEKVHEWEAEATRISRDIDKALRDAMRNAD
jgi:hypothetical protein